MLNHSNLLGNEVYRSEPFIIRGLRRFTQIVGREQLNQSVKPVDRCLPMGIRLRQRRHCLRIRAASRMKFGLRTILVGFCGPESLRMNSDRQSIKRLPRQLISS